MSRPVNPLTKYKMIVHTIGNHRYASTKINSVDKNGKTRSAHKHWGTLDSNNKFYPNATFLYESLEERAKLIFTEDWDLSELGTIPGTRRRGRISYDKDDVDLFGRRARRLAKDELCAVDSTSISTYGFNLADIRWGKNKERLPLRQTMEVVVYSLTSHMPIYYKELPGNMPYSRTIDMILKDLRDAGFKNLVLITDRSYDSMKNIERYISLGQKVITSVKVGSSDVLEKIRGIDMSHGYPTGMDVSKKDRLYYRQYSLECSVRG